MTDPDMSLRPSRDQVFAMLEAKIEAIGQMTQELVEERDRWKQEAQRLRRLIDNWRDGGFYEG